MGIRSRFGANRRRSIQKRQLDSPSVPSDVAPPHARPARIPITFALHKSTLDGRLTINLSALAACYGLAAGSWVEWNDDNDNSNYGRTSSDYIHLYPRPLGDYATALAAAVDQATK